MQLVHSRLDFRRFLESGIRSSREGGAAWAHFPNSDWLSSLAAQANLFKL